MNCVYKYLCNNIMEKKTRTVLVLLSISVSAALFFATMGMSSTCQQMYVDQAVQWGGTSDIRVEVKDEVGQDQFIGNDKMDYLSDKLEYRVGLMKSKGLYNPSIEDMQYLDVVGTTLEDLETFNTVSIKEKGNYDTFEGNKMIISTAFAKRAGLKLGDSIAIKLGRENVSFVIEGIAEQKGLFLNESLGVVVVVPRMVLEQIYQTSNQNNLIFLKLKNENNVDDVVLDLSEKLENCKVKRSVNQSDLNQAVNTVVMPFQVSALTVIFMSIFIIFTSFNLMTLERMPAIGTFRSIGLSKRKLKKVFTIESMLWGIAGGVLGCVIGIIAMYTIVVEYVSKLSEGTQLSVSFGPVQIILTIGLAVVLTMVSAIPPLFRSLKKSTKNIILNINEDKKKKKGMQGVKLVLLTLIYIACVIVPHTMGASLMCMIITIVCMTFILLVMILVIPYGINFVSKILSGGNSANNSTWLAVRNVETNKSMLNIVRLLTISISSILIISNISNSIANTITSVYDTYHLYNISLSHRAADEEFSDRLSKVDGVEAFANSYELDSTKLEEEDYYLNTLYGIDNPNFFHFMGAEQDAESENAIAELNSGRNVVLTKLLASKLNLHVGDQIHLNIDNKSYPYTITGFVESSFKLGNIGFVSAEYLRQDIGIKYYTNTYVKTNKNVETVRNNIKAEFLEEIIFIQTLDELVEINQDLIVSIFRIINAYAILAVIIGIIGIVNNIFVCFLERKRELAMYRTVGMSKKIMKSLFVKESLFIGIFGIVFAFIGATGILNIVPSMLSFIFGNVIMEYNLVLYAVFAIVGLAVMSAISILPIVKGSKLNIIESIKYE